MTETKNIRVLIADDHAVVREGLRSLITTRPGLELVGALGRLALEVFQKHRFPPLFNMQNQVCPRGTR